MNKRLLGIGVGLALLLFAMLLYWAYQKGAESSNTNPPPPDDGNPDLPPPHELEMWQQNVYASKFADELYTALRGTWGDNSALDALLDNILLMQPDTVIAVMVNWDIKYNSSGGYTIEHAISQEYCWFTGLNCQLRDQVVTSLREYRTAINGSNGNEYTDNWPVLY